MSEVQNKPSLGDRLFDLVDSALSGPTIPGRREFLKGAGITVAAATALRFFNSRAKAEGANQNEIPVQSLMEALNLFREGTIFAWENEPDITTHDVANRAYDYLNRSVILGRPIDSKRFYAILDGSEGAVLELGMKLDPNYFQGDYIRWLQTLPPDLQWSYQTTQIFAGSTAPLLAHQITGDLEYFFREAYNLAHEGAELDFESIELPYSEEAVIEGMQKLENLYPDLTREELIAIVRFSGRFNADLLTDSLATEDLTQPFDFLTAGSNEIEFRTKVAQAAIKRLRSNATEFTLTGIQAKTIVDNYPQLKQTIESFPLADADGSRIAVIDGVRDRELIDALELNKPIVFPGREVVSSEPILGPSLGELEVSQPLVYGSLATIIATFFAGILAIRSRKA